MSADHEKPEKESVSREEIDASFARIARGSGPLDGQTFVGTATEEGKTEPEPLHLEFRLGALLAVECMPYAFGAGPYTASTTGDGAIEFTSEIRSLEHETENHLWKGRVRDGAITGTMIWTDRGGKRTAMSFEGRAKGADG